LPRINLVRGVVKKELGKGGKIKPFTLHHCWTKLENDEK
jgi:hypothetical protein